MVRKLVALCLGVAFSFPANAAAIPRAATVTVNTSGSGLTIPANFVGISGEIADFIGGYYQGNTGAAASYCSLANLLGANGVLRLGGGAAETGTAPVVTSQMAANLNSFLTCLGAGYSLIYGLDIVANDPTTAATTAGLVATAVGNSKVVFQFGNEPSLFMSLATYQSRWNSYYSSVSAAVSGVHVGAIDDIMNTGFAPPLTAVSGLSVGLSGLSFISQHWYSFCRGTWTSPGPQYVVSSIFQNQAGSTSAGPGYLGGANQGAGYFLDNGKTGAIPQIMSETNTICSQGQDGASNRLEASTWFVNMAIGLANAGWTGVNIHNNYVQNAFYNPFIPNGDSTFSPGTIFYGMLLFSKIEGQQILPYSIGGNANVNAIATKGGSGNANILVVNNDIANPVTITPSQSGAWTTANVLQVQDGDGQGCGSGSPIVGGQSIGKGGAWTGSSFSINNGKSIQLAPCGSALIQIQP